jgi:hypothetical protein
MDASRDKGSGVGRHTGSCHCGAVRYEVDIDPRRGSRCNCSICTKLGITSGIVRPDAFRLLSGQERLSSYAFGPVAKRSFCQTCGIHTFGYGFLEQLGGDYVSINLNTLDDVEVAAIEVGYFDGRHNNWEAGLQPAPWPIFVPASA